jgi:succinate dehydrogenase / fumarate reductase cytochrome b subunit
MSDLTKQRPKFLTLTEIRLPLPGVASILHRISGAGMFLLLPALIWLLQLSLDTASDGASAFAAVTGNWCTRLVLLGLIWAFLHHFCMGIRLLLIDLHIGVDKPQARASAKAVFAISLTLTAAFGLKLFGVY